MSYFVRIYCRADKPLTRARLVELAKDGVFFEAAPTFQPADAAELASESWETLQVLYAPAKRLIILHRSYRNAAVEAELAELRELLAEKESSEAAVVAHLHDTVQVYAIEIAPDHLTGEAWELVDAVGHHFATELDGIVYAPGDGLFDKDLKRIVSVNGSRPNRQS